MKKGAKIGIIAGVVVLIIVAVLVFVKPFKKKEVISTELPPSTPLLPPIDTSISTGAGASGSKSDASGQGFNAQSQGNPIKYGEKLPGKGGDFSGLTTII